MGQLYINDVLMDMSEKTIIAATKQINDIGSLDKVKGDTTNQFKLPLTKTNLEALGLPGDLNFSQGYEYEILRAKYVENGAEVIPQGSGVIEAVNDNIEMKVLSGNTEFFDLMDGSIKDLFDRDFELEKGLASLDHFWNRETIVNSFDNTSGFIYPIVDYGDLANNNRYVNTRTQRPAVFVHEIISRISLKTGFEFLGDVFGESDYLNELIPFSGDKLEQPDGYQSSFYAKTVKTDSQFNYAGEWFKVSLPNTSVTEGGYWTNNRFVFQKNATIKFIAKAIVTANLSGNRPYRIAFRRNGEVTSGPFVFPKFFASVEGNIGDETTNIEFESEEVAFSSGDYVELWAWRESAPFHKSFRVEPGTFVETKMGAALYGSEVSIQKALPDHSIKDFLKNLMYRYCLIVQTDNVRKTVTFRPFSDVNKNILRAKDWSEKVDVSEPSNKEFSVGNYAQTNIFAMKADEGNAANLGNGSILIADKTLELSKTIITSLYAASSTVYRLNGNQVAQILKISAADLEAGKIDFSIKTTERIVRLARKTEAIPLLVHEGNTGAALSVVNTVIPYTYFDNGLDGLGFDRIISKRYVELKRMLTLSKKVTEAIRLNENDVADFDFFIPVYLKKYAHYFFVNKISNYVDGQKTKVELIRL